jgi:glycerophosphoryl diester phosphodiesterase
LHWHNYFKGKRELHQLLQYEKSHPLKTDRPEDNFIYVAHAGGNFPNKIYPNSLEAINNCYRIGMNYIEVDIEYTSDSVVVLSHDYVDNTASEYLKDTSTGTHLLLKDFLSWLSERDVILITDVKSNNAKILQQIIRDYPSLKAKIIPQVYTIPEIILVKEMGYTNVIYTNYISTYPNCIVKELAETNSLYAITLPYDRCFKLLRLFEDIHELPTPIFTHTVNDPEIVSQLQREGFKGVYTDTLLLPSSK